MDLRLGLGRAILPPGGVVAALVLMWSLDGPTAPEPPRAVVLIVVDTLRADHLGVYGHSRPTSPRIDALAEESVLFLEPISPSPWTLPALATLMTSLNPTVHGARGPSETSDAVWLLAPDRFRPASVLHESRETLAELLSREGFATAGFVQGSYPAAVFGFDQGFDHYADNATPGLRFDVEAALRWLDTTDPDRFFLYLHAVEVHAPYAPVALPHSLKFTDSAAPMDYYRRAIEDERQRFAELDFEPDYVGEVEGSIAYIEGLKASNRRVPEADLQQLEALYDRGIAYADYWIGELLDGLKARGLYDDTIVIVTSDHGEEFMEHGRLGHLYAYYEESLKVPLIIRVPREGQGVAVAHPVGLIDVLPTVLDVLEIDSPPVMQGVSLRPSWREGLAASPDYFAEASYENGTAAIRSDRYKYVWRRGGPDQLYELAADPGEQRNVCGEEPVACEEMRQRLRSHFQRNRAMSALVPPLSPKPAKLDPRTRAQLEALGYGHSD